MGEFYIISADKTQEWMDVLSVVEQYDFYHLPGYHQLHEDSGKGVLVVFREGEKIIALPLLIRKISSIPGLEKYTDCFDATSVYGYPGPIVTDQGRKNPDFSASFFQILEQYAFEHGWVCAFSRLNPLLKNHLLFDGLGEIVGLSDTVAIDLAIPPEKQVVDYRKSHRYEIRRGRREGVEVYEDTSWEAYEEFVAIYLRTMERVGAAEHYFFDHSYFEKLRIVLGDRLRLFVAEIDNHICAASLFVLTSGIIQYHLSATNDNYMKLAPSKIILDEVRQWGNKIGARWLHLGGGVGSAEDSLFRFKAGFSPLRFPFHVWRWIVQPDLYKQLIDERRSWYENHKDNFPTNDFFPAYRL